MLSNISLFSLIACGVYAVVTLFCVRAGIEARAKRQHGWHVKTWFFVSAFFVILIFSRLMGLEDLVREEMRGWLQAENLVDSRRAIQGPVVAVSIALFAALAMYAVYWVAQRIGGRRNLAVAAALGACGVMTATIVMRTVSLHALDGLLFGPLKLNWIGDMGSAFVILGAAIYYVGIVTGQIGRKR